MTRQETPTRPPESPSEPRRPSWWGVVKRSIREFQDDRLTDWAAVLTYYGILSIFPAMLAVVSILGLFGSRATGPLLDNVSTLAPGPAQDILTQSLESLEQNQGGAGLFAIIGIAVAIWSASGYIAAFMRASNAVYDMPEGRPIWKTIPLRVVVTLVLVVLLAISAVIVVFTGGVADRAGQVLGIGDTGVTVWNIAKWPVLLLAVMLVLAILYWAAPNVRHPGFRWITPGSALAVILWVIASVAFGFYVANFGSYNKTYGTLAGMVIFLIWLWVTNLAVLFGVELDAELVRARAIEAGHPADQEPYIEPRDTRKFPDETG
jgi:membrane protein